MLGTFLLVTKGQLNTLAISPAALAWGLTCAVFAAFYHFNRAKSLSDGVLHCSLAGVC